VQIDSKEKPEHIGIILDGNRRWATARDMIPWEGHREGAEKVKKFLQWCIDLGIRTVTLYGFSTENFQRSKREVEALMKLYEENLRENSVQHVRQGQGRASIAVADLDNDVRLKLAYNFAIDPEIQRVLDSFYAEVGRLLLGLPLHPRQYFL